MNEITLNDYYKITGKNHQNDYSQMSLREELAARLQDADTVARINQMQPKPDYSHLSLREELAARLRDAEQNQAQMMPNQNQTYAPSSAQPITQPNPFNTPYNPSSSPSYSSFTAQPYPNYLYKYGSSNIQPNANQYAIPQNHVRNYENDNYLPEEDRRNAIKQNKKIILDIKENPNANGKWPFYHSQTIGEMFVKKYEQPIEYYAKKYNVDADLVKAVMYTENATGHNLGLNYLFDFLHRSKSQAPMNIRGDLWGDMQGKHFDTYDPYQNIELSTILLKKLSESIKNPTIAKIGTLWNNTSANMVTDKGARVEYNYRNKWWDTSKTPILDEVDN